jgi:hypothetical protein
MHDHFFDSSDYSSRAVETVLGSYIMAVLFWNGTQTVMVVLFWNGGSSCKHMSVAVWKFGVEIRKLQRPSFVSSLSA